MDIREAITELGLEGEAVCVHASLSSFGCPVPGILDEFLKAGCTVMVPSFSYMYAAPPVPGLMPERNGIKSNETLMAKKYPDGETFSTDSNKVSTEDMGMFPKIVLEHPGRVRGNNYLNSFTAAGPDAERLVGRQTNGDVYAPLDSLYEMGGYILLIGVGLDSATAIHYAEQRAGRKPFIRWARGDSGETVPVRTGGCSRGFEKLSGILKPYEKCVCVGESKWRCYRIRDLVDACEEAFRKDPDAAHCDDPDCRCCRDAARGGPCPVLSLIIPTYNCAEYLDETLGSVLPQLPEDHELVLVDDGSTDGTAEMLEEHVRSFKAATKAGAEALGNNVKIVLRGHEGASSARNAGIDAASGRWIAFMDCDDLLMDGFFSNAREVMKSSADLYIFSFERVELELMEDRGKQEYQNGHEETPGTLTGGACREESVMPLEVLDRVYESTSDFADEYVRTRHLLIYSACNKVYDKTLMDEHGLRFRTGMEFGEDRLFNYDYLKFTERIVTSKVRMFRYMQRNPDSASKRSFPDYFNTVMMLHRAKMDCFLGLSEGTSRSEKRAFAGYDLSTEIERMIDRFDTHPNEIDQNLPLINRLIFGETDDVGGRFDIIIVLGSRNCGYRAEAALKIGEESADTIYIVTGGNPYGGEPLDMDQCGGGPHDGGQYRNDRLDGAAGKTEAAFMAEYLRSHGVDKSRIIVEDQAENTFQNLDLSARIIEKRKLYHKGCRIGIVTAGFHIPRTRMMKDEIPWYDGKDVVMIPAYGEHTRPDNWYANSKGRNICLGEIAKCGK